MIIETLKEIAKYYNVTKSTIARWHSVPTDPELAFPLIAQHTGHGQYGIKYVTDTDLVRQWMANKALRTAQLTRIKRGSSYASHLSPPRLKGAKPVHERPRRSIKPRVIEQIITDDVVIPLDSIVQGLDNKG